MQALLAFFFIVILFFIVIIFVIAILGASVLLRAVRLLFFPFRKRAKGKAAVIGADGKPLTDVMEKDPVCGMYLPRGDAIRETFGGKTVYFCSTQCLSEYKRRA